MARRPDLPQSWKVSLPCSRAEAEQLNEDVPAFALLDSPPVLMTSEHDPATPERWRLDAYFEERPNANDLALLVSLVPSAAATKPLVERIETQDWVTLSQQGLNPIKAGSFFVHTRAHREESPVDGFAIEIDAGRAFGTGHHETTTGCLLAIDSLRRNGSHFSDILDLGTGTGLLAFAAHRLWPTARLVASDIDPVAIEVTTENALANCVPLGRARGRLELVVAQGLRHARLRMRAPYDLILTNILAGPLIELAPAVAGALAPGGTLVLAGLLDHQVQSVTTAYRRQKMISLGSIVRGEWPTLIMRRRVIRRPMLIRGRR